LIASLADQRPIVHSESDFQHALAWHRQQRATDAAIRLEYCLPFPGEHAYADLWSGIPGERPALS